MVEIELNIGGIFMPYRMVKTKEYYYLPLILSASRILQEGYYLKMQHRILQNLWQYKNGYQEIESTTP